MQTLVAYVENKPGVLNRVSSLARRLAINIDSLTVGPTDNDQIARMTIVAHTDAKGGHRLEASLEKLVDVLLAENISERSLLERDLALIKVKADGLIEVLRPFGVLEMARSGRISMTRGGDLLQPPPQDAPTATVV
jgi:acetolactate synthase-1/3 small subunit